MCPNEIQLSSVTAWGPEVQVLEDEIESHAYSIRPATILILYKHLFCIVTLKVKTPQHFTKTIISITMTTFQQTIQYFFLQHTHYRTVKHFTKHFNIKQNMTTFYNAEG